MFSAFKCNNGALSLIIFAVEKQSVLDTLKVCRSHWPRDINLGSAAIVC